MSGAASAASAQRFVGQHLGLIARELGAFLDAHPDHRGELLGVLVSDDDTGGADFALGSLDEFMQSWRELVAAPAAASVAAIEAALRAPLPPPPPDAVRLWIVVAAPDGAVAVDVRAFRRVLAPSGAPN